MITNLLHSLQNQHITNTTIKSYQPGQIFHGKVLKLFPSQTAEVQVGNQKFIAKLEVPLSAGLRYWFQVQAGEGKVHLKVMPIENKSTDMVESTIGLLKQMNLPPTKENIEVLSFFIKEQLPLSKESIQTTLSILKDTGNHKEGLIGIKEMVSKNLPLTKQVFLATISSLNNESLQELVKNLHTQFDENSLTKTGQNLVTLLRELGSSGQEKLIQGVVNQLVKNWLNPNSKIDSMSALGLLQKLSIVDGNSEENLLQHAARNITSLTGNQIDSSNVKSVLRDIVGENDGLIEEATFNRQILSLVNSDGKTTQNLSQYIPVKNANGEIGKELLTSLLQVIQGKHTITNEEVILLNNIIQDVQDGLEKWESGKFVSEHIKSVVGKLGLDYEFSLNQFFKEGIQPDSEKLQVLKGQLLQFMAEQPTQNAKEASERLLNKITGMQLQSNESGPIQQYVLQVPISFWNKTSDLTIQWNGQKKENGQLDPNYCRVLFYLELEFLDEVIVDMQIQNRIMNIRVINDFEGIKKIAEPFVERLKVNLEELGFKLSNLSFRSTHDQKVLEKKQTLKQPNYDPSRYSGVDIKI